MGRCVACNRNLSDSEATRKSATTGEYLDLCNHCYKTIEDDVPSIEGEGEHGTTKLEVESEEESSFAGIGRYTRIPNSDD